jgi:SecD/SecF fusion protein
MQAKGFIRLFIVALIVVAIYQLSFTFFASNQEKKAEKYAAELVSPEGKSAEEYSYELKKWKIYYLDSIKNVPVVNLFIADFTYRELQERQLSLGLDLKGGISMLVEIDQADVLRKLALESKDATFNSAIDAAIVAQTSNPGQDDFLALFLNEYTKLNPEGKLAAIFAPIEEFREKITWESSNAVVIEELRKSMNAKINETYNILVTRIDQFGVAQPFISQPDNNGRIYLELPGAENTERIRTIIQTSAILEFYETYEMPEVGDYLADANEVLRDLLGLTKATTNKDEIVEAVETEEETAEVAESDLEDDLSSLLSDDLKSTDADTDSEISNPLFEVLFPNITSNEAGQQFYGSGAIIGFVTKRNIDKVNEYLAYEEVKAVFPRNLKLLWSAKPITDADNKPTDTYALYAIKKAPDGKAALTGDVILDAFSTIDELGRAQVNMSMNAIGAKKWADITRENTDKQIAIVLDNKVFSAPVSRGEITGGRSQIDGMSGIDEARDLANILKSGKIDARINIPQEAVVGATLGKASIKAGISALAIGLILVLLFMVLYYGGAGFIANIALVVNLVLIIGALASMGAALTLPGMAGIVLTIGMAVDANVIIFERIREELRKGKGMRLAIADGFSKSYSAIIDANVTTLIASVVLLWLGRGPVQGFAIVLIIGIIASLISAVLLSRLIFDGIASKDKNVSVSLPWSSNVLNNTNFDFLSKRKVAYGISAVIILAGLASIFTRGFELGVDFKGGRSYVVAFDQNVQTDAVRNVLTEVFENQVPVVKTYGGPTKVQIITSYEIESTNPKMDSIITFKLYEGLQDFYAKVPTYETFTISGEYLEQSNKVDTSIADDIKWSALKAGTVGALLIFFYLLIRFRKWQFGVGALGAVIHDILILLGVFSLFYTFMPFSMEVEQKFIAAVLTIIGYSINDTVVVFDRIREYFEEHPSRSIMNNMNAAINSTLSRTLMTSLTTFLVVVILFVFGGDAIRGFSFALLLGVLVGTYSSIFIASSILFDTLKEKTSKKK